MPELPDITVYIEALERRLLGARLESTRIAHPFLLRTFDPPISALYGRKVVAFRRVGKRIADAALCSARRGDCRHDVPVQ